MAIPKKRKPRRTLPGGSAFLKEGKIIPGQSGIFLRKTATLLGDVSHIKFKESTI
jgi:hypothetical protein